LQNCESHPMHIFGSGEHTTTSWGRSEWGKAAIKVCHIKFVDVSLHFVFDNINQLHPIHQATATVSRA
jgi:hypothetical protein